MLVRRRLLALTHPRLRLRCTFHRSPNSTQRKDGSWYGNWAVCFTYGTWFGCEALAAVGEGWANSAPAKAACTFLLGKQRADGGWGESYLSCQNKVGGVGGVGGRGGGQRLA